MQENNPREERIKYLTNVAEQQLKSLRTADTRKGMIAQQKKAQIAPPTQAINEFDASLKGMMSIPPPPKPVKKTNKGINPFEKPRPRYNDPE